MIKRLAKANMVPIYLEDKDGKDGNGPHEEYQYLNLIHDVLCEGTIEKGRNGITKSIFGSAMVFSLSDGIIPILTTKRTAWKTCIRELLWFIRGDTNNANLQSEGVHIWDDNGSREFLDSRQL